MSTRLRRRGRRAALAGLLLALLAPVGVVPAGASGAPENGRITFGRLDPALGATSLWTADIDGTRQRRLTREASFFSDWSPSGTRVAFDFEDATGVHIATVRPDGTDRRALTSAPGVQEAPDWSPDGRWIAYDAYDPAQPVFSTSIWVMRADGSGARQVTRGGFDVEPVFSPDGTRIAFGRLTDDSPAGQLEALYVVNTDGTGLRQVIAPRAGLEHPDWSPDGRSLIVNIGPEYADAADAGAVLSIRPDGRGLHVLRPPTSHLRFFKATWSPDGRQLLMGCFDTRVGRDRVCTSTATGNQVRVLGLGSEWVNFPAWGPRPR
jgi:dipeptidyl aminopeptidase/acylaminoacyl peptidase